MEDENKIRLKNALRLVSASNEDLFFDSNSVYDDSSADNCVQVKDPFDDDTINDSDGENETPDPIQMHGKRPSRTDEAIGLMAKFTIGHQKAAEQLRSAMSAEDLIVCAENLQDFHVNPKKMSFDAEFIERVNRELDACSLEALRNQRSVQTKTASGDRKQQLRKNSQAQAAANAASATGITVKELNIFETIDANAMSGIWSMLAANSMKCGFPITTDGYNIFNDNNIEWLKRPIGEDEAHDAAVAAAVAHTKCEKWLNKSVKPQKRWRSTPNPD